MYVCRLVCANASTSVPSTSLLYGDGRYIMNPPELTFGGKLDYVSSVRVQTQKPMEINSVTEKSKPKPKPKPKPKRPSKMNFRI